MYTKKIAAKHEFAFYVQNLSSYLNASQSNTIRIDDVHLYHRIVQVLRLQPGETVVVFNAQQSAQIVLLEQTSKKCIEGTLVTKAHNTILKPTITVMLPVLKKEALQEAVYSCVELGANAIQLVITKKTQRPFGGDKEMERLHNIMVAAAEQSKNFSLPQLCRPQPVEDALNQGGQDTFMYCDINGKPLVSVIEQITKASPAALALCVGPEGDFTDQERALLVQHGAIPIALTPTVLRAQHALVVALGAIRSIL